ncbi:MAG: hypothetical protein ACIARR_06995, partial [Phycisphaerales bacterium JB059]
FLLHLLPKIGLAAITRWLAAAPGLDLAVAYFTVAPQIVAIVVAVNSRADANAWAAAALGLLAAVLAQIAATLLWGWAHELANPKARRGPRIVAQLNRSVGRGRNHLAVWWTAWAVPIFAIVRVAELFVYPPLIWLVKFPRYRQSEWINISRHKFDGLVGHDLIWCLYCDWMTGVWSLGTEMLRNVESFWCPIRFDSTKKCANCAIDFPDIDGGWVPADKSMADVVAVLDAKYPRDSTTNAWFAHPVRLTREGKQIAND